MTQFRTWLFGIVAASMAISLLYALIPKGAILTAAKCAGSLILLLVIVRPLLTAQIETPYIAYEEWEREVSEQSAALAEENREALESLIEAECCAYISEKAEQLGLTVSPQVGCVFRDDVPIPETVWLGIPYHRVLSEWLAEELGIMPEKQYWQKTEEVS